MAIKYKNSSRFNRLFKKLCKKYKTLPNDFDKLKKLSISLFHNPDIHFDNQGIVKIPGFNTSKIVIFKVKKFACRSLKGGAMSGLRVVYAYHIKKELVEFIEIYYKGNQSNHNEHLINEYLKQFCH